MKIIEHVNAIVIEQIKYLLVCLHDACEIGSSASVQREIEREKQAILRASLGKMGEMAWQMIVRTSSAGRARLGYAFRHHRCEHRYRISPEVEPAPLNFT
jgi:hypothetical protein